MSSLVSGVLNRESVDIPTILENQESKVDDLELRQLNGDETLLMTENFEAVEKKSEVRGEKRRSVSSPDGSAGRQDTIIPRLSEVSSTYESDNVQSGEEENNG